MMNLRFWPTVARAFPVACGNDVDSMLFGLGGWVKHGLSGLVALLVFVCVLRVAGWYWGRG